MGSLIPILLAFPPDDIPEDNKKYDSLARSHVNKLSEVLKGRNHEIAGQGSQCLSLLNPAYNSLSYLAVLHTLVLPGFTTSIPREELLEKIVTFLITYDPRQIRYAGSTFADLLSLAGNGLVLPPSIAVQALSTAILRLDPAGSMFTQAHFNVAKLAYQTDNTEHLLPVINSNIVYYPGMPKTVDSRYLCDMTLPASVYMGKDSGLNPAVKSSTVLEYDLVCGLIYTSRGDWSRAYEAFERVITYPTKDGGVSKIMIEAYKKWVLVSLLHKGKADDPPPHTGSQASKLYANLGKPYTSIATLFDSENAERLKEDITSNTELWAEDGNLGLLKEVLGAYQRWQIRKLRNVYTKISISEIRQQTRSAETGASLPKDSDVEALIQSMIVSQALQGVVEKNDDGTAFLTFLPESVLLSEAEVAQEIAKAAARIQALAPIIKATNERLGTNKEYIKHLLREQRRADKGDGDDRNGPLPFESQVEDEDLMGGPGIGA